MYSVAQITDIINIKLSKKRYHHSLNVADEARKLSEYYGVSNPEKAYLAGLLHDICKEISFDEQLAMVRESDRNVCDVELITPPLYHAIAGAYYIEHSFSIYDDDFLNSIRYHTVGRAGMSRLEEIIYISDIISADRNYKDVNRMRKIAYQSLEKAMLEALRFSIMDIVNKGSLIPIHTAQAYNQYMKEYKLREEE